MGSFGREKKRASQRADAKENSESEVTKKTGQKKSKARRVAAIIAISFATLVALVIIGVIAWIAAPDVGDSGLKQQATPTPEAAKEADIAAEPSASPRVTQEPNLRREDTYTLLVVGRDRVGMNTDTVMVARLDCNAGTLDVVSIPRDTLVNVPWAVKKVNSIYGSLSTEGLVEHVENLVGFDIDSYVIINTYVFQQLIDCIGGVYFDVPIYMIYDDPGQNLHIYLTPGYQLLNGYQAEQVVRFRQNNDGTGYPDGDLGRINTQHAFFQALAKQVISLGNVTNLPQMINIVLENTDTNLTSGNMAFYAQEFLKLDGENIHFYTMPHESVEIRGGSYVSIQIEEWLDMINTCLNPFTVDVTEANLDILTSNGQYFYSTTGNIPSFESFYNYYG